MQSHGVTPATGEFVVLVDEGGREIGTAPKLASQHAATPPHKAFSCYIFNESGQFLVTQRALSKKVWPGVWTNSVFGHPGPNETNKHAIIRRAHDELNIELTDIKVALPDYRYKTPPFRGIVENEIFPVYFARARNDPYPNPHEVEAFKWMPWSDYLKTLNEESDSYAYWAKDQALKLLNHPLVLEYTTI